MSPIDNKNYMTHIDDENYEDVEPVAKRIMYMNDILSLRPESYSPLTATEEAAMLIGFPKDFSVEPIETLDEADSMEFKSYNPQVHRLRRVLLLRQRKRQLKNSANSSDHCEIFSLQSKIRKIYKEIEFGSLKLIHIHSRKLIQSMLQNLPEELATHTTIADSKKKGRRSKEEQERLDSRRALMRSIRLEERKNGIEKLEQKHLILKEKLKQQKLKIKQDLEYEINNPLPPIFLVIQNELTGKMDSSCNNNNSDNGNDNNNNNMDIDNNNNTLYSSNNNYENINNNVSNSNNNNNDNNNNLIENKNNKNIIKNGRGISNVDSSTTTNNNNNNNFIRDNLSSNSINKKNFGSKNVSRSSINLENRKRAIFNKNTKDSSGSAEMEQYLIRTTQYIEAMFDPHLDPAGEPWSFEEKIYGDIYNKCNTVNITSLWSGRVLKPIVRQDYESEPLKLRLLLEIERRQHLAEPEWIAPSRAPIEYKYLRPHHLPQVKKLLCDNFWPGIDVSESLLYPEHTIVTTYKELVIGAGFITNFGYITYICVHPEWRGEGIGKFILYHLIQTCPQKDITLHVSVVNPVMILYQKFCFKIEEFIIGFYDKFLPNQKSSLSKDSFFMRLRR